MQSLVADLWPGGTGAPFPLPSVVEFAFKGADLDEGKRIPRAECRDMLKCVVYLDTMADQLGQVHANRANFDGEVSMDEDDFIDACAAVKEPITVADAKAEFRQIRDQDGLITFNRYTMWLARRNVLDASGTPTLAGTIIVPSGADMTDEYATLTAETMIAGHSVAEAYASTLVQQQELFKNRPGPPPQAAVQWQPSDEFIAPAEVQTDIPELVLGGDSCPKVPLPTKEILNTHGTMFDFQEVTNENQAMSWRTTREIDREQQLRSTIELVDQVATAAGNQPYSAAERPAPRPAATFAPPVQQQQQPGGEEPSVVDVEPVVLGNTTYLVDKVNGVVYSNELKPGEEPVVVGKWNAMRPPTTDGDDTDEINRWTNTGAAPHPNITTTEHIQRHQQSSAMHEASAAVSQERQARSVNFSARTKIDVGSVPSVPTDAGHTAVPLWSAGVSDDLKDTVAQYGRDGQGKAPSSQRHYKKGSDKLQFLASHGLDDWPDPNAQAPVKEIKVPVRGRYHQETVKPAEGARPPSPRSPRWDVPPDEKEPGRDLAPSSPRGTRKPIEDGIRSLRAMNGTKHTGNSHTPGVSQSRTLPPRERGWAGLTNDPLVKQRRDEINEKWREEHPLPKLEPTEEAAFNATLAMERRVLASDQQSWAYLSLQRMAEERDLVATAPEHFLHIAAKHAKNEAGNTPSMGNYTLGGVAAPPEGGHQRSKGARVSIQEEQNRYSEPQPEPEQ